LELAILGFSFIPIPKENYPLVYFDDDSIHSLFKSINRTWKENNMFRYFFSPAYENSIKLLSRFKWYDDTITLYYYGTKKKIKHKYNINYCNKVLEDIVTTTNNVIINSFAASIFV